MRIETFAFQFAALFSAMTTPFTEMLSLRRHPVFMAGVCLLVQAGPSAALQTEFLGPEVYEPDYGYLWSDNAYWSDGVPGSDSDVLIYERLDDNSESYPFFGPLLDVDATVTSLYLDAHTSINNALPGTDNKSLSITGFTQVGAASSLINFAGRYSLGTFDLYNPATKTLGFVPFQAPPYFYVGDRGSGTGILEFRGADIVTNGAVFVLYGRNAVVRDQNSGLNAFRNLAVNNGILWFNDGYRLTTAGNLTNAGSIGLNINPQDTRTPELHISGNLVNNGYISLYPRSVFTVAGGLSGSGNISIYGLPVTCEVLGVWNQNGGSVNLGGSGLDGFVLKAIAFNAQNNTTVSGNGTMEAPVTITSGTMSPGNSSGTIIVKGDLTLEAGAKLEMEIAGTAHDRITQNTGAAGTALGGVLEVTTIGDFDDEVLHTSTYDILTSDRPLAGSFTNAASGTRLNTADGKGSFRVDYGPGSSAPNRVVLSDYIAVNAPQTYTQWIETYNFTPEFTAPDKDPNEDGLQNLEAYFRGIPADGATTFKGLNSALTGGGLVLTIRSPRTVTGVTLTSKISATLESWEDGPVPVLASTTPTRNIYQITLPASDPRRFARFVMTQNESPGPP